VYQLSFFDMKNLDFGFASVDFKLVVIIFVEARVAAYQNLLQYKTNVSKLGSYIATYLLVPVYTAIVV
jgi:hypothetical protein